MNVGVICEESQEVCKAFRALGHTAFSNDLQDCSGGYPDWHLKMDAFEAIELMSWDLLIMHPPCTYVSVSGNKHYAGHWKREQAAIWTNELFRFATNRCPKVAMENPVGVLNTYFPWLPKPYYIQPWQFGHGETKKTGIWSTGLPKLKPSDIVGGREERCFRMPPSKDRPKIRSKTYPGIAKAMAEQWG